VCRCGVGNHERCKGRGASRDKTSGAMRLFTNRKTRKPLWFLLFISVQLIETLLPHVHSWSLLLLAFQVER
jgi:hypothetical protein